MLGSVFGRYRITARLAVGGMGEVFLATHELMKGKQAVVKILLPSMSSKTEMVRRFFYEAQAAASIDHPGIVEVFDVGAIDMAERSKKTYLRGDLTAAYRLCRDALKLAPDRVPAIVLPGYSNSVLRIPLSPWMAVRC